MGHKLKILHYNMANNISYRICTYINDWTPQ